VKVDDDDDADDESSLLRDAREEKIEGRKRKNDTTGRSNKFDGGGIRERSCNRGLEFRGGVVQFVPHIAQDRKNAASRAAGTKSRTEGSFAGSTMRQRRWG
jgi:hypothetical protein